VPTIQISLVLSAGNSATNAYSSNFLGQKCWFKTTWLYNSNFFVENAGYSATTANNSNFFGRVAGC
jgi:hypothetical protein